MIVAVKGFNMQKQKNPVLHGLKVFVCCASIIGVFSCLTFLGARDTFYRAKGRFADDTKKSQPVKPEHGVYTNAPKTR